MGLYEGLALELKDQVIAELKQALAEKDREIAKWKAAHAEMVSRNKLLRDRPDLPADRIQAHDEWVEKYQQLMEKAVLCLSMFMIKMEKYGCWEDGCFYYNRTCASELQEPMMEAQAFLKSPEVQAWKEKE